MSRFEDTLQRDLTVIADRATPSPDAWATIQQRIADQDPIQETEIIMLTDNTTTTRRWPLVAAAAAVIAVVAGAIVFVGTGDDEIPADDPTPTVAPTPPPDDVGTDEDADLAPPDADPDTEPAVAETEDPAVENEAEATPVALSLTGTTEGVVEFDQETGTYTGTETIAGDIVGTATVSGTVSPNAAGDGLDGSGRRVIDVSIDGIGFGSIVVDDVWSSTFDGATETTGTIVGGTGDFAGAAGTWQGSFPAGSNDLETDPVETGGPYTVELTLPPEGQAAANIVIGSPDSVLPAGTYTTDSLGTPLTFDLGEPEVGSWGAAAWQGGVWIYRGAADEFIQITRVGGWYDAEEARNPATNGRAAFGAADVDGWIENSEDIVFDDLGEVTVGGRTARLIEFSIDPSSDAGDGICEADQQPCVWYFERSADGARTDGGRGNSLLGGREVLAYVIDMDGYEPILVEGSTTLDDQQAWLDEVFQPVVDSLVIGEPAPTVPGGTGRATIRVTATGTGIDDARTPTTQAVDATVDTFLTRYDGDAVGVGEGLTARTPLENEPWTEGRGTITFDGQIAGLGDGTFTIEQLDFLTSTYFAVGVITGGTGDFAGASGTVRFDPNAYTFDIEVPGRPVESGEVFELTTSWSDGDIVESTAADGSSVVTGATTWTGQLAGESPWTSTSSAIGETGVTTGSVVLQFSGTIEGVGSGTLTMYDVSRLAAGGYWVNAQVITGGTGDFSGATGWMLGRSTDGAATGTSEVELRLPAG